MGDLKVDSKQWNIANVESDVVWEANVIQCAFAHALYLRVRGPIGAFSVLGFTNNPVNCSSSKGFARRIFITKVLK